MAKGLWFLLCFCEQQCYTKRPKRRLNAKRDNTVYVL
jgi:hypothetical protein